MHRAPLRLYTASFYLLFLFALLSLLGCGDGRSSVSGTLTLDGKPLARSENVSVTIMFFPESGSGAPAAALADESGRYSLTTGGSRGLAPGNYIVALTATEVSGGENRQKRLITPERYAHPKQSDLRVTVEPGSNTFNFDLTADGETGKARS